VRRIKLFIAIKFVSCGKPEGQSSEGVRQHEPLRLTPQLREVGVHLIRNRKLEIGKR